MHRKATALESFFNKVASLMTFERPKRGLNAGVYKNHSNVLLLINLQKTKNCAKKAL